jgi:hypothetical protein
LLWWHWLLLSTMWDFKVSQAQKFKGLAWVKEHKLQIFVLNCIWECINAVKFKPEIVMQVVVHIFMVQSIFKFEILKLRIFSEASEDQYVKNNQK